MARPKKVFDTDKRIRLGIWGLGRGMSFFDTCKFLNIDVVAGCDYNPHMRERFLESCPGAYVTDNEDEFLAQDFDAVLLATYCVDHARGAIKALKAGKHVLSEVTSFFTLAQGVELVETVERTGKVYNLAENYPFSVPHMYLQRKWKEGLFGELMYAEFEYVHECRSLCYTYIDGVPVKPGNYVHNWRSWLNAHYYCTHSLGPVMVITGTRPTRVTALPSTQKLAGFIVRDSDLAAPSLITMSNGGLVRNLMGATTNDSHIQRLWGTLGAAEVNTGHGLLLRLGSSGGSPKHEVRPDWDALGELAAKTGHGGGDFWVLYYFAREILTGEKGPFDIYGAADVTIPGILAARSAYEDGKSFDVPDFRIPAERDKHRNDTWGQEPYPADGAFPKDADFQITQHFSKTMADLIQAALRYRACADWSKVAKDMVNPMALSGMFGKVIAEYPRMRETYAMARRIVDAYPNSDGGRVLREMLDVGLEKTFMAGGFLAGLKRQEAALNRRFPDLAMRLTKATASAVQPKAGGIAKTSPPRKNLAFQPAPYQPVEKYIDICGIHNRKLDGLVYIRGAISSPKAAKGELLYGADGPVKVWFNGRAVACQPRATNPCQADTYRVDVTWKKGANEIVFAIDTNKGLAWGVTARGTLDA